MTYTSFRPGEEWLDTDGNRIEAHGGALWFEDGTYYWYGENKDHTEGKNGIWTWGIKYYSSTDLYNWKYEGYLVEPDPEDETSLLHPKYRMDRPHIVRSAGTGKYVCWLKYSGEEACFALLTADRFTGPYTLVKTHFRPFGKKVGDFDLCPEPGGRVYLLFDSDHAGLTGAWLTPDCLDATGEPELHCGGLYPPFCREAPAHFVHGATHYLITSGMTGYLPNPSRTDAAEAVNGPYRTLGDPHVADESRASFDSQISQVFKMPGDNDLYIALADRWVPDYKVTAEVAGAMERAIGARFDSERWHPTQADRELLMKSPMLASADTSRANYVWLPVLFDESGEPRIEWRSEWRWEDFVERRAT